MTCTCALETFFRNHQERADPLGIGENFLESSPTFLCVPFAPPAPSTMGRCNPKSLVRRAACFAEDAHGEGTTLQSDLSTGCESKGSLCPLQITSSNQHRRIAYPCKISEGGFYDVYQWCGLRKGSRRKNAIGDGGSSL